MADGRREEQWNHTSHVLAMLHNSNVTKEENLREPQDFNPLHPREEVKQFVPVSALKGLFGV